MSDDFDENQGMPLTHAEANRLADERERVRAAREWWIETENIDGNRIFEIQQGKMFLEYKGKHPVKPTHVIEYSAVGKLRARVEELEAQLARTRGTLERSTTTLYQVNDERDSWKAECEALRKAAVEYDEGNDLFGKNLMANANAIRAQREDK